MMAQMPRMMRASGAEFDAMFLTDMIPHHASGIEMARRALPNLHRPELRTLATAIQTTQAREIEEMTRMRDSAHR